MQIPEKILEECHTHGASAYPEESCGFIVGKLNDPESLETVYPMSNIMNEMHKKDPLLYPRTGRDGYMINPIEHIKLERSLKKKGKQIKIIYHSHPDVGAYFSEEDKKEALWNGNPRYPGISFLVCATNQGKPGNAIIAKFNSKKSDFDIFEIQSNFSNKLLGGNYGISGILPTLDFIHEWKNGKCELEYGYFRFVPTKQVKTLQQKLAERYKSNHALTYSSGRSALLEYISYLQDSNSLKILNLCSNSTTILEIIRSLAIPTNQFNSNKLPSEENFSEKDGQVILITPKDSLNFVKGNSNWLRKLKQHRIPVIIYEEASSKFWKVNIKHELINLLTCWIIEIALPRFHYLPCKIEGGVILSDNDRQIAELSELRKRRGSILSARNADFFCEQFDNNEPYTNKKSENTVETKTKHICSHEELVTQELCKWESTASGLLFPSGMAAIMTLITLLKKKKRKRSLIVIGLLYSDTYSLLIDSGRFSKFDPVFLGLNDLECLPKLLNPDTAMVITETITNPLCEVPDLERIGKITNEHGVPFIVDNTLASPLNCQPTNWGADYVIHSTTKYLSGSNDHAGGAILVKKPENAHTLMKFQENWGLSISPLEAKVLHQRMQDFEERMVRFNQNNMAIVNFLRVHPAVDRIYHAFSPNKISNSLSSKFLTGSGGVVSFVLKNNSEKNLRNFYDGEFSSILKAPTLGSNQTLVCPYTVLTHYHDSDKDLLEINLPRYLIRIASGSEKEVEPIIEDLNLALARTTH